MRQLRKPTMTLGRLGFTGRGNMPLSFIFKFIAVVVLLFILWLSGYAYGYGRGKYRGAIDEGYQV